MFNLFGKYKVHNLYAILVNYVVAAALGLAVSTQSIHINQIAEKSWLWGAVGIGFLFIVLFQLMAKVSQMLGVSRVSIAVKMSVVLPVVAGIWLFGEHLSSLSWLGVLLALAAVFLGTYKKKETQATVSILILLMPVVLFLGSGLVDISMKYAQHFWLQTNEEALFSAVLFGSAFLWGILFSVYQIFIKKIMPQWRDLFGGILLGIPNFGSIYFLLKTLDTSGWPSAAIYPVNNVAIVLLSAILGVAFFKETMSKINLIGLASGLLAIYFIFLG